MATHSSIPAWRILWTEESGGLQSIVSQRIEHDWSELACIQTYLATVKEGQTTFQNWWDILRRLILIHLTLWVPGNILSNFQKQPAWKFSQKGPCTHALSMGHEGPMVRALQLLFWASVTQQRWKQWLWINSTLSLHNPLYPHLRTGSFFFFF